MCSGSLFGGGVSKPSAPAVTQAPAPQVSAAAPPAEAVAEAPVINENDKEGKLAEAKKKGASGLKINLNLGGVGGTGGGGTNALAIPS